MKYGYTAHGSLAFGGLRFGVETFIGCLSVATILFGVGIMAGRKR